MIPVVIGLATLVAIPLLLLWFLRTAAENKQQASNTQQGTIEFVVAGKRCIRLLENVRDKYWSRTTVPYRTKVGKQKPDGSWELVTVEIPIARAIVPGDVNYRPKGWRKIRHYLRSEWGFYWVSLFYPLRQIHRFKLPRVRLSSDYESGHPLSEWVERDKEYAEVNALQYEVPRPIVVSDLEFKDLFQASIGVVTTIQFVTPEKPVFTFAREFYQLYESTVQGATVDYAKGSLLAPFISEMAKGPNSDFFAAVLSRLNVHLPENLKADPDGIYRVSADTPGLITQLGIEITTGWIGAIHEKESIESKAQKARRMAELEGEGEVMKATKEAEAARKRAEGTRDAARTVADGEAAAIRTVGLAEAEMLGLKVEKAGAAATIADLHRQALEKTSISTLVETDANATVLVNAGEGRQPSPKPTSSPPPKDKTP